MIRVKNNKSTDDPKALRKKRKITVGFNHPSIPKISGKIIEITRNGANDINIVRFREIISSVSTKPPNN
jgi:hydroxylamine reductase (hybrid-cluster protein)